MLQVEFVNLSYLKVVEVDVYKKLVEEKISTVETKACLCYNNTFSKIFS